MYIRNFFFIIMLFVTMLSACTCNDKLLKEQKPIQCVSAFDLRKQSCKDTESLTAGVCISSRCDTSADCCPGQICNSLGACINQYIECDPSAEKPDEICPAGQKCITGYRGGNYCAYQNKDKVLNDALTMRCDTKEQCDSSSECFAHRCVSQAPCNGSCALDEVCDVDSNLCVKANDTCKLTACKEGEMRVFLDPDTMSGQYCCLAQCVCEVLPSVPYGYFGQYNDIAVTKTEILLSAYDEWYGDLVLAHYTLENELISVEYVDGFSDEGPIRGNPNGIRLGRSAPGPNVGKYSKLILFSDLSYAIAYQDVDQKRLKYAKYDTGQKQWKIQTLDTVSDTGYFISAELDSNEKPRIVYHLEKSEEDHQASGVIYFEALVKDPKQVEDWQKLAIDKTYPPIHCLGTCKEQEACIFTDQKTSVCKPIASTCAKECGKSEACIANDSGNAECKKMLDETLLPKNFENTNGLFPTIIIDKNITYIAYYDSDTKVLKGAFGSIAQGFKIGIIDDGMNQAGTKENVGSHPSIAVSSNGTIGIVYRNLSSNELILWQGKSFDFSKPKAGGNTEIVAKGGAYQDHLIGADAHLLYHSNGNTYVIFQNASTMDLIITKRSFIDNAWTSQIIAGDLVSKEGETPKGTPSGFFARMSNNQTTLYISNYTLGIQKDVVLNGETKNVTGTLSLLKHPL